MLSRQSIRLLPLAKQPASVHASGVKTDIWSTRGQSRTYTTCILGHVVSLVQEPAAKLFVDREKDLKEAPSVLGKVRRIRFVKVRNLVDDVAEDTEKLYMPVSGGPKIGSSQMANLLGAIGPGGHNLP